MNTINIETKSFENNETNNKLGYKRIVIELSQLPMKQDDFIISSNYILNNSSIYSFKYLYKFKNRKFQKHEYKY